MGRHSECQVEMQAYRCVELIEQGAWRPADSLSDTLHVHGPQLFGLCLRERPQPRQPWWDQDLERVHDLDFAREWDNRYDASSQLVGSPVSAVVAHEHGWPNIVGFAPSHRLKVHPEYVPAKHHPVGSGRPAPSSDQSSGLSPSPTVDSQSLPSPWAHSSHAAS